MTAFNSGRPTSSLGCAGMAPACALSRGATSMSLLLREEPRRESTIFDAWMPAISQKNQASLLLPRLPSWTKCSAEGCNKPRSQREMVMAEHSIRLASSAWLIFRRSRSLVICDAHSWSPRLDFIFIGGYSYDTPVQDT